ncbi:hypothetical protein [Ruegeria sp. YS9]|uniref:hypothetical protein n=1 Tax=Ruegeria sp. YS9 TaxID=2966453 RepID=UPI00214BA418|nr:hypothetical protein [Ruegeria sp. YS9]UUV08122.1 hypothetical protein NOR97_19600 [Ruegeria sp. YS9]
MTGSSWDVAQKAFPLRFDDRPAPTPKTINQRRAFLEHLIHPEAGYGRVSVADDKFMWMLYPISVTRGHIF